MSAVTFVHAAPTVSGLTSRYTRKQNAPDNSEDVKPKYYVIVTACAEAFPLPGFDIHAFYYYVDNPHGTYNYVLNGSSPPPGKSIKSQRLFV